jgi:hypothetical protein
LQLYAVGFRKTRSGLTVTRSALSKLVQSSLTGSIAAGFALGGDSSESEVGFQRHFPPQQIAVASTEPYCSFLCINGVITWTLGAGSSAEIM